MYDPIADWFERLIISRASKYAMGDIEDIGFAIRNTMESDEKFNKHIFGRLDYAETQMILMLYKMYD